MTSPSPETLDLPVSIVVPSYNEARRLPQSVRKILAWMRTDASVREIVLVDDGSSDDTPGIIRRFATEDDRIRAVSYWPNGGKGYAIRRGVLDASPGHAILLTDADLSTPIDDLAALYRALGEHDVVIGSRALALSRIGEQQAIHRRWMGKTFNRIMRRVTGLPFADTQCGFKLFRPDAAKRVFAEASIDRFAYDVEALLIADKLGYSIGEVPVQWDNSADSRVRIVRDSFRMLLDVVRARLRHGRFRGRRR
jgi:dolichyl-phosphate beta-glucosyltransferase